MRRIERLPARLVHVVIEAGQDDRALRQFGDGRQQVAGRGLRAGRAGGDHLRLRRPFTPASGLIADRQGAPLDGIDPPTRGEHLRPVFADDGQELQRALPVAGEVAFDEAFEPIERHAFDGEFVEQAAELAGKFQRLCRRLRNGMALVVGEGCHELCEQRLAFCGLDGGRQGERVAVARGDLPFAVVDVAQRRHAGQDRGRAVGGPQEGLAQGPDRAARRQQDQHVGEGQRIAAMLGQHHPRQLVGEAPLRADGEEAFHPSTRSASASADGVPTWNQSPSWTRANRRPACSERFHSFRREKGPSGEPLNRRESQTEMLAKR